jgi:hypothetical protein
MRLDIRSRRIDTGAIPAEDVAAAALLTVGEALALLPACLR